MHLSTYYRVDATSEVLGNKVISEAKPVLDSAFVHDEKAYPVPNQPSSKGRKRGTPDTAYLADRNKQCPNLRKLSAIGASDAKDTSLRHMDSLKIVTNEKKVDDDLTEDLVDVDGSDNTKALNDQLSNYTSQETGLKVLSVTSSSPGYTFTTSDRARLVKNIPGVVIINAAGKGDSLLLGVDIEDENLVKLIPILEKEPFKISLVACLKP